MVTGRLSISLNRPSKSPRWIGGSLASAGDGLLRPGRDRAHRPDAVAFKRTCARYGTGRCPRHRNHARHGIGRRIGVGTHRQGLERCRLASSVCRNRRKVRRPGRILPSDLDRSIHRAGTHSPSFVVNLRRSSSDSSDRRARRRHPKHSTCPCHAPPRRRAKSCCHGSVRMPFGDSHTNASLIWRGFLANQNDIFAVWRPTFGFVGKNTIWPSSTGDAGRPFGDDLAPS